MANSHKFLTRIKKWLYGIDNYYSLHCTLRVIIQVNEKLLELKGTYRDCRKSAGDKLGYQRDAVHVHEKNVRQPTSPGQSIFMHSW